MADFIKLPTIRRLLQPDPGHLLCDCDLSGADAQVVAWDANEKSMMSAFRQGLDIHNFNGKRLWGDSYEPKLVRRKLTWRDECKRGVHGTTYLSSARGLARTLGWRLQEVELFQSAWFRLCPSYRAWQERVHLDLSRHGKVRNMFGYDITYFDRPANILPKALAWIPQSTVAIVSEDGAVQLDKGLPWVEVLLQVHDSVLFQVPYHRVSPSSFEAIKRHLEVVVPYPDPLLIPWGLKASTKNWQELQDQSWSDVRVAA